MRTRKIFPGFHKTAIVICFGFLSAILTACSIPKDHQGVMKKVTTSDNSFAAGYIDGCDSGFSSQPEMAGRMYFQDINRYRSDMSYAAGWESGYKKCFR